MDLEGNLTYIRWGGDKMKVTGQFIISETSRVICTFSLSVI